ncbi:hypothetical protein [Chitinibacter sp. S2-10]|uniref:hypothetical protein n=1 Tax=Chitinibacter sp. S2-10 TaxID=3373597 RepID=UPI003977BDF3
MKAIISETILWLLVICFCLLQLKLLLPQFCFGATDLEEFEKCGASAVMDRFMGSLISTPVFLYAIWKTLDRNWRTRLRQSSIERSQWIRHWILLIGATPGTLIAFNFLGQLILK